MVVDGIGDDDRLGGRNADQVMLERKLTDEAIGSVWGSGLSSFSTSTSSFDAVVVFA